MKKSLFLITMLTLSFNAFSKDIRNDRFEGLRKSNNAQCVIEHRELDGSPPDLLISLRPVNGENTSAGPDTFMIDIFKLDYANFKKIFYGNSSVNLKIKDLYDFTITASSQGAVRTVNIVGNPLNGSSKTSLGQVVLRNGVVESASIEKRVKGLFGVKTAFKDSCHSFVKIK